MLLLVSPWLPTKQFHVAAHGPAAIPIRKCIGHVESILPAKTNKFGHHVDGNFHEDETYAHADAGEFIPSDCGYLANASNVQSLAVDCIAPSMPKNMVTGMREFAIRYLEGTAVECKHSDVIKSACVDVEESTTASESSSTVPIEEDLSMDRGEAAAILQREKLVAVTDRESWRRTIASDPLSESKLADNGQPRVKQVLGRRQQRLHLAALHGAGAARAASEFQSCCGIPLKFSAGTLVPVRDTPSIYAPTVAMLGPQACVLGYPGGAWLRLAECEETSAAISESFTSQWVLIDSLADSSLSCLEAEWAKLSITCHPDQMLVKWPGLADLNSAAKRLIISYRLTWHTFPSSGRGQVVSHEPEALLSDIPTGSDIEFVLSARIQAEGDAEAPGIHICSRATCWSAATQTFPSVDKIRATETELPAGFISAPELPCDQ
jgi:hypothetical protein